MNKKRDEPINWKCTLGRIKVLQYSIKITTSLCTLIHLEAELNRLLNPNQPDPRLTYNHDNGGNDA